jgi:DNA-binding NarL/FixJ family response regulator
VLLVDDHAVVREGLAQRINREADLEVCGEAQTVGEARRAVGKLHPDIVVVDISLPDGHGLELIKDLKIRHPDLRMLVFTMYDESIYAERTLRAGAHGYITKQESPERVLAAIRRVLQGGYAVSQHASSELLASVFQPRSAAGAPATSSLTDRELEIFQLIGQGVSTRGIAAQLGRSAKTIETHRARVMEKLHLKSATALISRAATWLATGQ